MTVKRMARYRMRKIEAVKIQIVIMMTSIIKRERKIRSRVIARLRSIVRLVKITVLRLLHGDSIMTMTLRCFHSGLAWGAFRQSNTSAPTRKGLWITTGAVR